MPVIHFAEIIFPHKLSALEQAWKYVALLSVMHPIALPPRYLLWWMKSWARTRAKCLYTITKSVYFRMAWKQHLVTFQPCKQKTVSYNAETVICPCKQLGHQTSHLLQTPYQQVVCNTHSLDCDCKGKEIFTMENMHKLNTDSSQLSLKAHS